MKNQMSCEVIRDLLPSYIDGLTSEDTNKMIEEHMTECASCRETLEAMRQPETGADSGDEDALEIAFLKKEKSRRRNLLLLFPALGVIFLAAFLILANHMRVKRDFGEFAAGASRGDTFSFGSYEQDGDPANGPEEIVWIVLSNRDGELFAVSKYGLDSSPFHEEDTAVTWEDSSLRAWLNSTFYENAFSAREKTLIIESERINWNNPYYETNSGNTTTDKVSLLSLKEAEGLSPDIAICFPTAGAMADGVVADAYTGHCEWWLRTAGITDTCTCTVSKRGDAGGTGIKVTNTTVAVRPCITIQYE